MSHDDQKIGGMNYSRKSSVTVYNQKIAGKIRCTSPEEGLNIKNVIHNIENKYASNQQGDTNNNISGIHETNTEN